MRLCYEIAVNIPTGFAAGMIFNRVVRSFGEIESVLENAHGKEIELWASRIRGVMVECGKMLLVELIERSGLVVDLWLGLLLGDTGCVVSRQLSEDVEFNVDFYDGEARHQGGRSGIWIVELVT